MVSFLDLFRPKKRSGRRPLPQQPPTSDDPTSRVSKRLSVKEERPIDVTQMLPPSSSQAPPSVPVARQRKERRKRDETAKYHQPIVQSAEDVRTKQKVELRIEELHWHGGGVFSNVYRGKLVAPEKMEIAIKKTWPKDTVRSDEMIILAAMRRASPKNIIKLLYTFKNRATDGTECEAFIFGYMPETLEKVIRAGLTTTDMKIYIWQLFNGLDFLAANRIAHRDIKPINILVNRDSGELQIGDFGSAKVISSKEKSSAYQVTRYYRPPEMLLGSSHYSHLIDVWSAGCVLGEMIKGRVLFRGSDSENQMQLIQMGIGTPTEEELKSMKVNMKTAVKMKNINKLGLLVSLRLQNEGGTPSAISPTTAQAVGLLKRVLVFNPESRLCGREFLDHPFFADVLSGTSLRDNGRKPELHRQTEETMVHQCFERSQKSSRASRVSRIAPPPEKDEQALNVANKQLDKTEKETDDEKKDRDSPLVSA